MQHSNTFVNKQKIVLIQKVVEKVDVLKNEVDAKARSAC